MVEGLTDFDGVVSFLLSLSRGWGSAVNAAKYVLIIKYNEIPYSVG